MTRHTFTIVVTEPDENDPDLRLYRGAFDEEQFREELAQMIDRSMGNGYFESVGSFVITCNPGE